MKVNYNGCALCDSTWGDYYENVEGSKLFFCCHQCALLYKEIISHIKNYYHITDIQNLELHGNPRERIFTLNSDNMFFRGKIQFLNGKLINFLDLTN